MLSRLVFSQRLSVAFISLTNSYINMVNIDSIVATPSPESNDEIETVPPKKFRPSTPPVPPSEVTDVIVSYVKSTDDIKAPYRGSAAAAGVDLHAAEKVIIAANDKKLVSTGIKLALPSGTYGRVAPRSGLAFNHQIDVGAGVVDEDYRGEVKVLLFNCGQKDFTVEIGDRIAQFIVQQISSTKPLVSPVSEVVEIRRARDDVKYPTIENNAIIVYAAEDGVIPAKGFHPFPTAIHIALPTGYYGHASPLTPLATDHGLDLYAGVIDEDYRGELKVLLVNRSDSPYTIKAGDAIMQILVEKIANATYQLTTELTETVRGAGGFGSTGVSTTIDAAGDAPIDETVSIPRAVTFTKVSDDAQIPVYGTVFAAGADVYANNDTTIPAGGRAIISTGIKLTVAPGYYARVAPRSGLAVKNAIDVGAGVEWTSEEELKVLLFNYGTEAFVVKKGDRIAQIVGEQIAIPELTIVETLSETQRGEAGFGSTGVAAVPEGAKVSTT